MTTAPFSAESAVCRTAQRAWEELPIRRRLRSVKALRRLIVDRCDDLCTAVNHDVGRPPDEVLGSDLLPLAAACRFLERRARRKLRPRRVPLRLRPVWLIGQRDWIYRRPHGVVGIIGTWNYPLFLNGVQLVQTLTAGNGVLWKPSELSATSSRLFYEMLTEAGFPPELVQLLPASREGGPQLLEADIDHLVFTGSAAVGRQIARRLGERLISSTLELSGVDAQFVLPDADVAMAAQAAWFGATLNRGQTCLAVRRSFVHRSIYPAFVEELKKHIAGVGPMTLAMESQVRRAKELVADAVSMGGRILAPADTPHPNPPPQGGRESEPSDPPPQGGRETEPRVVLDATPEMALCREGCFAPLLAVLPFDSLPEAECQSMACHFALGASVFSSNISTGLELAYRLKAGMVAVNDVIVPTAHPATPFGGRGQSGWGVTQGAEGLLAMTVPQVISVRRGAFRPHYDAENPALVGLLRGALEFGHAGRIRQRLSGFGKIIRGLWAAMRGD